MLNFVALFNRSVFATTKYISSIPFPVEWLIGTSSTHTFINQQSRLLLARDGHVKAAQLYCLFKNQLDSGVVWVDQGLKSACHLYDPDTQSGMWWWPSALDKCLGFYNKSVKLWHKRKHAQAMFFLGAASHLVQDVCVPHHASCKLFNGHQDFEQWVEKKKNNYIVESGGIYRPSAAPEEWVIDNARLAKAHLDLVVNRSAANYHRAAEILLTHAQRTTAGFLLNFYRQL